MKKQEKACLWDIKCTMKKPLGLFFMNNEHKNKTIYVRMYNTYIYIYIYIYMYMYSQEINPKWMYWMYACTGVCDYTTKDKDKENNKNNLESKNLFTTQDIWTQKLTSIFFLLTTTTTK